MYSVLTISALAMVQHQDVPFPMKSVLIKSKGGGVENKAEVLDDQHFIS